MRIARVIPAAPPAPAPYADVAAVYGLTEAELRSAAVDWVQSEGYDEDGNEYETLHAWLTRERQPWQDITPWHKGDDQPS